VKYTCQQPIEHDQKRYDIGSEIDLDKDDAGPLLAIKHIAAPELKKSASKSKPQGGGEGSGEGGEGGADGSGDGTGQGG